MTKRESWNKYQNDYHKTHYTQLTAMLKPELAKTFKEKLKKNNIPFSTFIRKAIEEYLENK